LRRELQPNVLIHGDGTACVADFGLSLMYSEVISPSQASYTSTLKGNMRWMAPELLVLEREDGSPTRPSKQSDIFSFGGITLQVCLDSSQVVNDIISSASRSSPTKFPIITSRMMLPSSYA
jgi:serine/threonine protein kinase